MKYFAEHKDIGKLEAIRLLNQNKGEVGSITREQSVKICQLITSLSHIKNIEVRPLKLKRKELDYLSLWYQDGFGDLAKYNEYCNSRDTVLVDVKLRNF